MIVIRPGQTGRHIDKSVISVGNFDGVHAGHRELIETVRKRARLQGASSVIITFEPHTRAVLHPGAAQAVLTTFAEKEILIRELGIDALVCLPFTKELAVTPAARFVDDVLVGRYGAVEWVMGENHTFGRDREGTKNFLHANKSTKHITVFAVTLRSQRTGRISSTQIRSCIVGHRIREALAMLGHPYVVVAKRIRGKHRGTSLGFPTFNFKLPPSHKVIPPPGVYAAELGSGEKKWTGALYLGNCPTFADRDYHLEFHALGGNDRCPVVSEQGTLWIHKYIRKDEAFPSTERLVARVKEDIAAIGRFFREE
jgi:riboflavin kinase/FMN adenylyltransferase